jgi:hypothetical protein
MRLLGGDRPTGQTTLGADNSRGLVLDELRVVLPEANFGAVRLTNVSFEYKAGGNPEFQCKRKWWKATASVFLGPSDTSGGFRLAPQPRRNGIAFCNGSFHSAGGEIVFNPPLPRPQLFAGVELKTLGFEIQLTRPSSSGRPRSARPGSRTSAGGCSRRSRRRPPRIASRPGM